MNDWTGGNPFLGQNNPYLQQNIDATAGDITRHYNTAVKPNTESAMVNSGSFGNSGLQQMQQNQQYDLAKNLGNTSAAMRGQDYNNQQSMYQWDQGFNRNLFNDSFAQNQQQLGNYMGLLGMGNQLGQQEIANSTNMHNAPLNYQGTFSGMSNAAGGLGQTGTNTQNMAGNPFLGAVGGWGLGQQFGKAYNS